MRRSSRADSVGPPSAAPPATPEPAPEQKKREPRKKAKIDPKLLTATRELRDRWLERVNADPASIVADGKYDITRQLPSFTPTSTLALDVAA